MQPLAIIIICVCTKINLIPTLNTVVGEKKQITDDYIMFASVYIVFKNQNFTLYHLGIHTKIATL